MIKTKLKKIIGLLLVFLVIVTNIQVVNASSSLVEKSSGLYYRAGGIGGLKNRLYLDGTEVYCLEADKFSQDGMGYNYYSKFSEYLSDKNKRFKIEFFNCKAHNFQNGTLDNKTSVFLQLAIWKILGYNVESVGTRGANYKGYGMVTSNGDLNGEFTRWYNSIENDYNNFISVPSWDDKTYVLKKNKPLELSTENKLAYYFRHNKLEGLSVNVSNNKVILTVDDKFKGGTLQLFKDPLHSGFVDDINFVYTPNNSSQQKIGKFRLKLDPHVVNINLKRANTLRIKKVDKQGNAIPNTVFETCYSKDFSTQIWEYPTNTDGYTYMSENWGNKKVYIREKSVPYPYIKSDEVKELAMVDGQDYMVTFVNEKIPNNLKIRKVDTEGNAIPNTVFETCYSKDFSTRTWEYPTNADGYSDNIVLDDNYSKIYIREKSVPSPYIKSNEVKEIDITKGRNHEVTFINRKQLGSIKVYKHGDYLKSFTKKTVTLDNKEYTINSPVFGNKKLNGVKFGLYNSEDKLIKEDITKKGVATFSNLSLGKYYIKEHKALKGYKLDTKKHEINISADNLNTEIIEKSINLDNELIKCEIALNKNFENSINHNHKKQAIIGLYNKHDIKNLKANSLVDIFLFDNENKTHIFTNLYKTDYYVKEISTSNAYVLDDKEYNIKFSNNNLQNTTIQIENRLKKGNVKLIKVDSLNNKVLPGIKFGLYTNNDKLVNEYVTDKNGVIKVFDLEYGNYYFKELETLQGYILDNSKLEFSIKNNNEVLEFKKNNDRQVYDVIIKKVDSSTKQALSGVSAVITDEKGNKLYDVISNQDGVFTVKNKPIKLTFGKYKIKEIKALEGYILDTKVYDFEVLRNGKLAKEIVLNNDRQVYDVIIKKVDSSTKQALSGVSAVITDEKGNKLYDVISNQDGVFTVKNKPIKLTFGKYKIKEIKALEGYILDTKVYDFEVLRNGKLAKEIVLNNDKKLIPKTSVNNNHLATYLLVGCFLLLKKLRKNK